MNRQTRAIFFSLILLVGILAASTSFFFAKSRQTTKVSQPSGTPTIAAVTDGSTAPQISPASSSQVSRPATQNEKPSKPADIYTVQRGETLFAIAQSQGTSGGSLAEANGITDSDKIQAGQVLIVPKGNVVSFILDSTKATELQKAVDDGRYPFRLSPEETARSDAPPVFGIQVTDTFTVRAKDENQGTATVVISHEGKNYLIKLNQPVTRGKTGLWAIESIQPAV